MEVTREQVLAKIQSDDKYAVTMLIKLYERQTADEQDGQRTEEKNGQGFNADDAGFLSSLAQQAIRRREERRDGQIPQHWTDLSPRQMECLRKSIRKYARQMTEITNAKLAANAALDAAISPAIMKQVGGPLTGADAAQALVERMVANGASLGDQVAVALAVMGQPQIAERKPMPPSCTLIEQGANLRFPTAKELHTNFADLMRAEAERRNAEPGIFD